MPCYHQRLEMEVKIAKTSEPTKSTYKAWSECDFWDTLMASTSLPEGEAVVLDSGENK